MGDAISLGAKAFEGMLCPIAQPPECVLAGGRIDYSVPGEAVCPICGIQSKVIEYDTGPQFDSNDQIIYRATLSKTGAKRNREASREKLLSSFGRFEMSANAQAEAVRIYDLMLTKGYHKGGTGLDAVVNTSIYHGLRYDYNFMPLDEITKNRSTDKKKVNSLMKRLRRDKIIQRQQADALAILNSALKRSPQANSAEDLARRYAQMRISNLRPDIHASGALYTALKQSNVKTTQESVGNIFYMSSKNVRQGYKAITEQITPKSNPPVEDDFGLTAGQLKLLRQLR